MLLGGNPFSSVFSRIMNSDISSLDVLGMYVSTYVYTYVYIYKNYNQLIPNLTGE